MTSINQSIWREVDEQFGWLIVDNLNNNWLKCRSISCRTINHSDQHRQNLNRWEQSFNSWCTSAINWLIDDWSMEHNRWSRLHDRLNPLINQSINQLAPAETKYLQMSMVNTQWINQSTTPYKSVHMIWSVFDRLGSHRLELHNPGNCTNDDKEEKMN